MTAALASARQDEHARQLEHGIGLLGLKLDQEVQARLLQHLDSVEKWNRIHNLTAIRDKSKAVSAHLLDSLSVLPYLTGRRVLDAGSGAGFPGIPLALARQDIQVDLLDSSHKKYAFLRHAIADLHLANANAVCQRLESWRPARKYDFIVSRALGEIAELVALSAPLLAPGGVVAAMKGIYPFEEIERVPPGFRVRRVHALSVPGLGAERHLVVIERA